MRQADLLVSLSMARDFRSRQCGRGPHERAGHGGARYGHAHDGPISRKSNRCTKTSLLFYRMGISFNELLLRRCGQGRGRLDIAPDRKGKDQGKAIPMCGVPVHAAEAYLEKLIRKGFPRRGLRADGRPGAGKEQTRREIAGSNAKSIRLVTPGTLTEETLLDARAPSVLTALGRAAGELALAWVDILDGGFRSGDPLHRPIWRVALARLSPHAKSWSRMRFCPMRELGPFEGTGLTPDAPAGRELRSPNRASGS